MHHYFKYAKRWHCQIITHQQMYDTKQFKMLKCEKKKYVLGSIKYGVSILVGKGTQPVPWLCVCSEKGR